MPGMGDDRDPLTSALGGGSVFGAAGVRAMQGMRHGLAGAFDASPYSSGTLGNPFLPRLDLTPPPPPEPSPSWFTPQRRPNTLGGERLMPPPPPPPSELNSRTPTGRDIFFERFRSFGIPERQARTLANLAYYAPTGRVFEGGRMAAEGVHTWDPLLAIGGVATMAPPWFQSGALPPLPRRLPTPTIPTDILRREERLRTMLPSETVDRILRRPVGPDPRGN